MLRYFPAYLAEYYYIYDRILREKFIDHPLRILSVGTGCGTDYYGLHCALKSHADYANNLEYKGVDIIEWEYRKNLGRKNVEFVTHDISAWPRLDNTYNVIMFAKSLSEFSGSAFNGLLKMFANSIFDVKKICVVCSIGNSGSSLDSDRLDLLVKTLTKHCALTPSCNSGIVQPFPQNKGIRGWCFDWDFPQNIVNFLTKECQKSCPQCQANNGVSCSSDCDLLSRNPILLSGRIRYQIVGLVKK